MDAHPSLQLAGLPLDAFPIGISVADAQGRILQINAAAVRLLGLEATEPLGQSLHSPEWKLLRGDGSPWPVEALPGLRALREQVRIEGAEMGVLRPDGEVVWLQVTAEPLGPDQVLITYGDVSESHRSKQILSARARLTEAALELSLEHLLRATLDEAETLTGSCIGFYHFMEEDQVHLRLQAWSTRTEAEFCRAEGKGSHYPIAQAGVWADCVRARRPLIHNDYASLPHKKGLPPGHATVLRELAVPVLRGGRVVAILGVGNKATEYRESDVDAVQRLADLAWDLADSKRTQELLLARERSFQEVIENAPLAMLIAEGPEEKVTFLNQKFEELFGYSSEEIRSVADWWPRAYPDPEYRAQIQAEWAQLVQRARSEGKRSDPQHVTVTCKDGFRRFIRIELANIGEAHVVTFTDLTERRQTEEVLSFLATCAGVPEEDFFQSLARFLAEKLEADFICIDQLEGDGLTARTLAVWCDGYFEDNVVYALKDTPCGEVVGKEVCCFPASVTKLFPKDQVLQDLRAESYAGVTLWGHTGRPVGLIAVIRRRPLGDPTIVEAVLRLVAGRASGELERVQTEAVLKESQEAYRRQFTDSISMMLLIDPEDGRIIDANPSAVAFYGHPKEHLLTMHLADINTLTPTELKVAQDSVAEGNGAHFEFRHRLADGSVRDVAVSSSRIHLRERVLLHSIIHDISERKRAEEALSRSQAELQAIYAHAPVMMCVVDEERRILYVNPAMTEFTGGSEDHLKGGHACGIFGCIHAIEVPQGCGFGTNCQACALKLALEDTLRNGRGHRNIEYRTTLVNEGQAREVALLASTALFQAGGQRFLLLCLHDITDRKKVEEALRVSEERYRTQFHRASEGIFSLSPAGDLIEVNEAFARMHGYTREDMLSMNLRDLDTPETSVQMPERMGRLLAGEALTFEVEHYHKDGHGFPMEVSASLVSSGGTPFILAFHREITERRQADAERRRLQAQLQQAQKMESLGSLAGGVAHDMNNVLGAILGLASAHLETQREGTPTHRALDTISKAAIRGGKMVQSLLRFARQSHGEEQELDLNTLLREEVRLLERTILAQVRLEMDLAPELRPIRGDASALSHALMNLCVNAVDAMPHQGTLTLRTRNIDQDWIEVLVADTGIGMPKEILEKAMDPFFTTKGVGKGTGLGLSIVYSTVKAHQGRVEIWSEPGQGTRVSLRFPACTAATGATQPNTRLATTPVTRALSVLVVDDDELIQSSMQSILEVLGHGAVAASSGEEALLMLEAGLEPDLVILDMNMPGLGGIGTLPRLRDLRPEVPVLLATGRADQTAQSLVDAHSGVILVPKPFGIRELQRNLDKLSHG